MMGKYFIILALFLFCLSVNAQNDVVKTYYSNGNLKSEIPAPIANTKTIAKEYHENGNLKTEIPFTGIFINGVSKVYFESGKLQLEETYIFD